MKGMGKQSVAAGLQSTWGCSTRELLALAANPPSKHSSALHAPTAERVLRAVVLCGMPGMGRVESLLRDHHPPPSHVLSLCVFDAVPPLAVGRKQFMRFEWATHAAEVLGCELEELSTAVFKHHLKQILAQAAARGGGRPSEEEGPSGTRHSLLPSLMEFLFPYGIFLLLCGNAIEPQFPPEKE